MTEYQWIPIATRSRSANGSSHGGTLHWNEIPDAPYTLNAAWEAVKAKKLIMMSRHEPDLVTCVVTLRPRPAAKFA